MVTNRVEFPNEDSFKEAVTFYAMEWDTEYFGVSSAKAILHKPLSQTEWHKLSRKFKDYQFISIENRNAEPANARLIGKFTSAYLVDVNIQFRKNIESGERCPSTVHIYQGLEHNEKILQMADFPYSKFTEDPELAARAGYEVYHHWIANSFGKENKFFAISRGTFDEINGFLLHSYTDQICTIELIHVAKDFFRVGVGTSLVRSIENAAFERGCTEIGVGTQMRNLNAINFYNKVGFRQIGCHQVFHIWKT